MKLNTFEKTDKRGKFVVFARFPEENPDKYADLDAPNAAEVSQQWIAMDKQHVIDIE